VRDVQRDSDSGTVAAREKPFAAYFATDRYSGQPLGYVAKRHGKHFAFDSSFTTGFGLHRLVLQRAVEGRNAGRGVAKVAALRESGS
jgi:hypothetical protein